MGLRRHALETLSRLLPAPRVLSLGYPDIVATQEDVHEIFGVWIDETTDHNRWHGVEHRLPETMALMSALGVELDCVDIVASRGVERIVDLNYPADIAMGGGYDLVIDGGTIEHCFMAGQALMNAAAAVAPGGRIWHGNPVSMVNHGFWNLCPTLLWDFYTQNGWKVEEFWLTDVHGERYEAHPTKRYHAPTEASLHFVARRLDGATVEYYPTQTKYLKNPMLH